MNKELLKNTIVIILLIGALFVCLVNFGKKVEPPYPLSFTVNDEDRIVDNEINTVFKEGAGGVTVDKGQTRAIFLDEEKKATDFKDLEVFGETVDYYGDAALDDKNVYLLTYERNAETGYVKNQKICSKRNSWNFGWKRRKSVFPKTVTR